MLEICHFTDTLRQELEDLEVLPLTGLEAEDGGAPVLGPRSNKTPGVMYLAIGK